ncbi:hypothetical protein [Paenibacillus sp. An7]|uniref:hypothetical protein n=1 Tax=Paenibacillus sp. An7 TaxID=2689577 RepID=UPI001357D457|nr:hypothetical protein [Paenibacillus sp. An7]
MRETMKLASLFVDSISWLTIRDEDYVNEELPNDYHFISPYLFAEKTYYGNPLASSVRTYIHNGQRLTSGDMANKVLDHSKGIKWDAFIVAQSYPDRYSLNPPLARLLEEGPIHCEKYFGLSHLGSLASVEFIPVLQWSMYHQALIVFTEQRILPPIYENGLCPLVDMAVSLELKAKKGALEIQYEGKYKINKLQANTVIESLKVKYKPDITIVQSRLSSFLNITENKLIADAQSGDIWVQLAEWLTVNQPCAGTKIMLVAWDYKNQLSVCCVIVHSQPVLNRITFTEGEICPEESRLHNWGNWGATVKDSSTNVTCFYS